MATIGDAMVTLLTDNWAGAGAPPTFGHLVDFRNELADTAEQVIVRLPVYDDDDPINDQFSNTKITLTIRVKTNVSDDRLKVLVDEVRRIVNTYAITGVTRQRTKGGENTSDRKRQVFSYDVRAICETHMTSGGTAYSSPGAGDVVFPADVTVTDDLITDSIISANPINIKPSGDIDDYLEIDAIGNHMFITAIGGGLLHLRGDTGFRFQPSGDYTDYIEFSTTGNIPKIAARGASDLQLATDTQTIGVDQIAALLMFGSANAAFVPATFHGTNPYNGTYTHLVGTLINRGGSGVTHYWSFRLPKPCAKGSLKLYLENVIVGISDADGANYLNHLYVYGISATSSTGIYDLGTNRTSAGEYTYDTSDLDVSAYSAVHIVLRIENDNSGDDFDLMKIGATCFYDV